ncbi:hypothetical protein ACFQ15_10880 [Sphingomonas hankookensis]|uniref:hypothetical protein n=1 Tax=Sphingomonas hankookensis TaxID=563996 RepID=UPI001F5A4FE9|nr:hypothetical protein [Sphingomonas hankookensis]
MLWLAFALQAGAPTLAEVELSLPQAVKRVLKDKPHGPIVAVENAEPWHPAIGGQAARDYIERPVALPRGCQRRRWRAQFMPARYQTSVDPSVASDAAILLTVEEKREVIVTNAATCPAKGYVDMDSRVDAAAAIGALIRFDNVLNQQVKVEFACDDQTRTGFCKDGAAIRRELKLLRPREIRGGGSAVTLMFLGKRNLTLVSLDTARPESVQVRNIIPPAS